MHRLLIQYVTIGVILSLQVFVILKPCGGLIWPFTDYPMYSDAHFDGDIVHRRKLFAVLEDNSQVRVSAQDFGLSQWMYQWGPLAAVRQQDIEWAHTFASFLERARGWRVKGFRLIDEPIVLKGHKLEPISWPLIELSFQQSEQL